MPICKLVTYQDPLYRKEGIGKFFDDDSYRDIYFYVRGLNHISYTGYNDTYGKEKMPSNLFGSRSVDFYNAPAEMEAIAKAFGKYDGTKVRHYILSLGPEECNRLGYSYHSCYLVLEDIAERFLDCFHGEYQCYYTIHEDTDNPHAHIVQSTVNYTTGKKYPGDKRSYFGIQNEMNEYLHREYGMHMTMVADNYEG